ncbi:MAG TPA: hypothetical protein VGQ38_15550 [Gaiellaceae bacterium]|jgi:hypothetical protein|nr:hypothetical protein [Gaiellaceae bacterium]
MAIGKTSKKNAAKKKLNGKHVNGANGAATVKLKTRDGTGVEAEVVDRSDVIGSDNGPTPAEPEQAAVAPPPPLPRTRYLKCLLSDDEKAALADELVAIHAEIEDVDQRIEAVSEQKKNLQKERDVYVERAKTKARAYRAGETHRDVPCREERDQVDVRNGGTTKGVLVIREDTDEPIDWRPYSINERQGDLFAEEGV